MGSGAISLIVFACVFGGAVFGMFLRAALPPHHLSADSRDVVKLGMGLVATMSALVLGLLVSSAKTFYDGQSTELTEISARIVMLDRVLAHYGPETKEARDLLRGVVVRAIDRIWPQEGTRTSEVHPSSGAEVVYDKIQGLFAPRNATVTVALLVSGVSVSGAIFLILEMYTPYSGLIEISSASLRFALAHLGQ